MENFSNDSEDTEEVYADQYETNSKYRQLLDSEGDGRSASLTSITRLNQFKDVFPSRNTFKFANGIEITSNFDAGNLMYCKDIRDGQTHYELLRDLPVFKKEV